MLNSLCSSVRTWALRHFGSLTLFSTCLPAISCGLRRLWSFSRRDAESAGVSSNYRLTYASYPQSWPTSDTEAMRPGRAGFRVKPKLRFLQFTTVESPVANLPA
ncbi:hypothetical protein F4860DRAFT_333741 [Xylaria cubensis]|nr:hypothetical protein F4860DRAFT_333741 [Xylaria cubensis]